VLFLAGGRSEILGASLQERQARLYPSAQIEVIAGGGHDFAWTHSAETVSAIRRYLGRVAGGAR
jgi:pimeloyl-ACP methyl ester carboxylesterase